MRYAGQPSWQIRERRQNQNFELALWARAAERLDVPARGVVPGPLLIDPLPDPTPGLDTVALAHQWSAWWLTLCNLPPWSPDSGGPPPQITHSGPDFVALTGLPSLRELMVRRWPEVFRWRTERGRAGTHEGQPNVRTLIAEIEQRLGRPVRPFDVSIEVLAVDDQEVRQVSEATFVVPEHIRDGAGWSDVLRGLIEPFA